MSTRTKKDKRLIELTVQKRAQQYLEQYYKHKRNLRKFYSNIEERTKHKYGMKRADGLLAYKLSSKRAYVVSMEAKSHKTLPALKPYRINKLWIKNAIWKGFLATMASGVIFLLFAESYPLALRLAAPLGLWTLLTLLHLFVFRNSYKYQEMKVMHQVFQYPANEKWLSLSEDSFEMIEESKRRNLFKICKSRGVGVLMVDAKKNVNMIHAPEKVRKWWGDYLVYYHNEDAIRKHLGLKIKAAAPKKKARKKTTRKKKK